MLPPTIPPDATTGAVGGFLSQLPISLAGSIDNEIVVIWTSGIEGTDELDFGLDANGFPLKLIRDTPTVLLKPQAEEAISEGAVLISSQLL